MAKKMRRNNVKKWVAEWKKFRLSAYISDFRIENLYWLFAMFSLFVLFENIIESTAVSAIVKPFLAHIPQNLLVDFVFLIYLLIAAFFLIKHIVRHIVPTLNSVMFGAAVFIVYFIVFNDDRFVFYKFDSRLLESYSYSTIFIVSCLMLLFSYKSYQEPLVKNSSKYSLLDDNPAIDNCEDVYQRSGYASTLANHIMNTSTGVSFAIAVTGAWGAGKSDFLLRLKAALINENENIVLDFNPWRINNSDAIIVEFFKVLSNKLKPYNRTINAIIRDYSSRILKSSKETQYRALDTVIGNLFKEEDIQTKYNEINENIKSTSKRLIVFIDDVDRLSGREVMDVLRIIRNSANFSNTFFIVGIDIDYIVSVLRKTGDFANEQEYIKKVFQLAITLPVNRKEIYIEELKKTLFTSDLEQSDKDAIGRALGRLGMDIGNFGFSWYPTTFLREFYIEKMIGNLRDLKRFCNSFKIAFNILKDEVDIHDLIMLELIRNKNLHVYNCLRNKWILTSDTKNPRKFILDDAKWATVVAEVPEQDILEIKEAILFLLDDPNYKIARRLSNPNNFYLYFSYQLFNLISLHEFTLTLEKNADDILETFRKWIGEGKEGELSEVIYTLDDFRDSDFLKKIITVLLKLGQPNSVWVNYAQNIVVGEWKINHAKYFESNGELHRDFLIAIFNDSTIEPFVRATLLKRIQQESYKDDDVNSVLLLSKKSLNKEMYWLFEEYLSVDDLGSQMTYQFYRLNTYPVKQGIMQIYLPATKLYRRYLLNDNTCFAGYVKILLNPFQMPYDGRLVFDPWLEEIFNDWKLFRNKLSRTEFHDKDMNKLTQIILKYISRYYTSNRIPFRISDVNDQTFIEKFHSFTRLR